MADDKDWGALVDSIDESGLPAAQNAGGEGRSITLEQQDWGSAIDAMPEVQLPGYLTAGRRGLQRGIGHVEAAIPTLQGVGAELLSDDQAAAEYATQATEIEKAQPAPVVSDVLDVQSGQDFLYWASERLGEQAPNMALMAAGGGIGGVLAKLVGRGLVSSELAATLGAAVPNIGLETAGTAQEQRMATGSYNPKTSIAAGIGKGILETYGPVKFMKELRGASILGAAGRAAVREGLLTEPWQESIDIAARKLNDPNYSFFNEDMTWLSKDVRTRLAESATTGLLVGGGYAGTIQAGAKALGVGAEADTEFPEGPPPIPQVAAPTPPIEDKPLEPGALSWLRQMQLKKQLEPPYDPTPGTEPVVDAVETGPIEQGIKLDWQTELANTLSTEQVLNIEDDNISRYAYMDSQRGRNNRILTDTDLEEDLARNGPLAQDAQLVKVDMKSLQPAAITAEVWDLPSVEDNRIWFLPGTTVPEQQALLQQYEQIQLQVEALKPERFTQGLNARAQAEALYEPLLNSGLRVIPSRGTSFNYNGAAEGEVVAKRPTSNRGVQAYTGPQDLKAGAKLYPPDAAVNFDAESVRPIQQALALDFNKIPDDAFSVDVDGVLTLKKDIDPTAITYGYGVTASMPDAVATVYEHDLAVQKDPNAPPDIVKDAANAVAWWKELAPYLKSVSKKLGISMPSLIVAESPEVSPHPDLMIAYDGDHNIITYNPTLNVQALSPSIKTQAGFLLAVLHEFGHAVTMQSWNRLPPRVQGLILEGYKRALLTTRITGSTAHVQLPQLPLDIDAQHRYYYLSFREYLAEQARRWNNSDATAMSPQEKFYASVGRKLQGMYNGFVEKLGEADALKLFMPDYSFNTWYDYLQDGQSEDSATGVVGVGLKRMIHNSRKLSTDFRVPQDLQSTYILVLDALKKFGRLVPESVDVRALDYGPNTREQLADENAGLELGHYDDQQNAIILIIGALAESADATAAEQLLVHEAYHSIQKYLTPQELRILVREAKLNKTMSHREIGEYWRYHRESLRSHGVDPDTPMMIAVVRELIEHEAVARLVESRLAGKDFGTETNTILDRIIELFKRIVEYVRGNGFQSLKDVETAFFRGEFAQRRNEEAMLEDLSRMNLYAQPSIQVGKREPNRVEEIEPGLTVHVFEKTDELITPDMVSKEVPSKTYAFTSEGKPVGYMMIHEEPGIGWDVDMLEVRKGFLGKGYPRKMFMYMMKDVGQPPAASGLLTQQGYNAWKRRMPEQVAFHVFDSDSGNWYSPRQIQLQLDAAKKFGNKESANKWTHMLGQVPEAFFKDAAAAKKFSRDMSRRKGMEREAQRGQQEAEQELLSALGSDQMPVDPFLKSYGQKKGTTEPEHYGMANVITWLRGHPTGSPNAGIVLNTADRINRASKWWYSIQQLTFRNPHIPGLRAYSYLMQLFNTRRMEWTSRADNTLRKFWDINDMSNAQKDAVGDLLFWATEMEYLTQAERQQGVVRHPTQAELAAEMHRLGFNQAAYDAYVQINSDFSDFLVAIENVSIQNISRTLATQPQARAQAIAEVRADMAQLRKKPYFPMARFGEYYISVRNQFVAGNPPVVWFSCYATERERNAAVRQVQQQHPGLDMTIGKVPENVQEFMGLPATLLRSIRAKLPGITPTQSDWLEQFQAIMAPERSFRKRFLKRKGTPGYSFDAMRVYASYFRSGANYLARIEYKDLLEEQVKAVDSTRKNMWDRGSKREMIVTYLRKHLEYVMSGGSDWATFKSVISIFQLGFSVAAAGMNLLQTPTTTLPHLSKIFGTGRSTRELSRILKATRLTFGKPPPGLPQQFLDAREEMIRQGKIDIGQAPELGGYAEGSNLIRLAAGNKQQRAWRAFSYWSMWLFQHAEQYNRELAFQAAYNLAMNDSNNPYVLNLQVNNLQEIQDLISRLGLSFQEATATVAGRETLDQTQFIYSPYGRPPILQSGAASSVLVFFQFTQNMLFFLGNNPGKYRALMMLLVLYGLAGLPGADDLDKLIKMLSRRMFEKNFSPLDYTREQMNKLLDGTMFDEHGADVLLHGISRYSFGAAFLPEGYGVPQFDASANGSMGNIIPGLAPALSVAAKGGKWDEMTAQVASDVAGAGFGQMFAWMKFMDSGGPFTTEQKKWEMVANRSGKAFSKAIRYAWQGGDINPTTGETFMKFNMQDPDDVATVVAQALGFTPRKMSEKWEKLRMAKDLEAWYSYRKSALLVQYDAALRSKDREAISDVKAGIMKLNTEVNKLGLPSLGISGKSLRSSIKARTRVRALRDRDIGLTKGQQQINRQLEDQFPDYHYEGEVESKPVR